MKISLKKYVVVILAIFVFIPVIVFAHQPRITSGDITIVKDPEISKAYYSQLAGKPQVYRISASAPFDLYVNVLVPDIQGQLKDVSAVIIKNGNTAKPLAVLQGIDFNWEKFFEPFGYDTYWKGPEYKARATAGEYEIRVSSSHNDSKYSLAIGEIEAFNINESVNALKVIPELKQSFFNESPMNFILSPFGWGYILIMYILAFVVGFIYRLIAKRIVRKTGGTRKNIGISDRLIRVMIGLILLLWAITTSWNPILLFISGFCIFEAIFSWCALYHAIGKNTCPI